ncbi:hypothetical protein QMK19_14285 [Streptomyces sp. H10-C2]|uniref:hypothetical protein n=1 Tax=unclassified Streptomyces TaxID=2593676 RepID=UPI0024B922DE|nr:MULTISPECIES: hypothetical protein [unclassified Streptomyces]MDJ0345040.1 hypothetical protein [Streptomyces sp. PH10-H1]MDJ0370817.1 hypothetical protein [Streptomyces sp. H10-C2]
MSYDEDYQDKSPAAGRMGKAAEYLVAAACILATGGELNVSTSLVDDEGVDLVFHRRGSTATLAVQVKARMSTGVQVQQGRLMAFVRSQTFQPRPDLDMLFLAVDVECGAIMTAWLVPSDEFSKKVTEPNSKGRFRFSASMKTKSKDQWVQFRLTNAELPRRILARLADLEQTNRTS